MGEREAGHCIPPLDISKKTNNERKIYKILIPETESTFFYYSSVLNTQRPQFKQY
jgi:hypothetical protein